jgi:hypothetical protein
LPPIGLARAKLATIASAYRATPTRTARASLGITKPTATTTARAGQKLVATNGKLPPSGKATVSTAAGATAKAPTASGCQPRWASHHAPAASATNAPATGLARLVTAARTQASCGRPRAAASTQASPMATPSAKVRRPVSRLVIEATANHSAAMRPPSRSLTRRSNSQAAATALTTPTRRGPTTAAIGGNSTL